MKVLCGGNFEHAYLISEEGLEYSPKGLYEAQIIEADSLAS